MMNIEQGISNYEPDIKSSSSTKDFMAGAVTRPTACTQYDGLMHQFRHSGRREATVRNLERNNSLLDTPSTSLRVVSLSNGLSNHGSCPPQADSSGMTTFYCLLQIKSKEKSSATDNGQPTTDIPFVFFVLPHYLPIFKRSS